MSLKMRVYIQALKTMVDRETLILAHIWPYMYICNRRAKRGHVLKIYSLANMHFRDMFIAFYNGFSEGKISVICLGGRPGSHAITWKVFGRLFLNLDMLFYMRKQISCLTGREFYYVALYTCIYIHLYNNDIPINLSQWDTWIRHYCMLFSRVLI